MRPQNVSSERYLWVVQEWMRRLLRTGLSNFQNTMTIKKCKIRSIVSDIVIPSVCHRTTILMATWRNFNGFTIRDAIVIWQDGLTIALWIQRWPHEVNTNLSHREVIGQFFDCQRFSKFTRNCFRCLRKSQKYSRWLTMSTRIVITTGPFRLPSCIHRNIKYARCTDHHTNITWFDQMDSRWSYEYKDGHPKSTRRRIFA